MKEDLSNSELEEGGGDWGGESGGGISDGGSGGSDMTKEECLPSHSDCSNSSLPPSSVDPALVSTTKFVVNTFIALYIY